MQYLMVGLALALFYLLLLALSEHMSFDLAYGLSAGALVGLITVYLTGVLRRCRLALGAGAGLATLYTMLYWILRSEDYSLLMGSLLLFGVLAILMIATRRVDWSNVARLRARGRSGELANVSGSARLGIPGECGQAFAPGCMAASARHSARRVARAGIQRVVRCDECPVRARSHACARVRPRCARVAPGRWRERPRSVRPSRAAMPVARRRIQPPRCDRVDDHGGRAPRGA